MSTRNERDEGREEKTRDRYLEAFKHMTTLNTAGALVLLAVYRDSAAVSVLQVLLSMAGFGVSLCLSLYGMYCTTAKEDIEARGYRVRWSEYALLTWALFVFILGVGAALVVDLFLVADTF